MNEKKVFYSELAYVGGIGTLALGTVLMEAADLGMSMVVAPAYLVYLKISESMPMFTFGMAEYCLQALLLAALALTAGRVKLRYLLSFGMALFYGLVLDALMAAPGGMSAGALPQRIGSYLAGMAFCSAGVALLFHTYIAPEAYELFVKELSGRYGWDIHRTKTVYDCMSCLTAVMLSFVFYGFGRFEGVKWGTILCALVNGGCIGLCSRWLERHFRFRDALKLRRIYE